MTETASRRFQDARIARTRATVLAAAAQLVTERGPAAFTVEAVVERSGVALTTVYRHWPTRADLLAAAIEALGEPPATPDTGTLRSDLVSFFGSRAREQSERWDARMQTLPGLIEAGQRDPELSDAVAHVVAGVLKAVGMIVSRAAARGEIRADLDPDMVSDLLLGAIFIRHGYRGRTLTARYVRDVVDAAIRGLAPADE